MTMFRLADPPREIEEEADRLLDEWAEIDTPLSFDAYLERFSSQKVKDYLAMMAGIRDE
jgi:hypothetical protein